MARRLDPHEHERLTTDSLNVKQAAGVLAVVDRGTHDNQWGQTPLNSESNSRCALQLLDSFSGSFWRPPLVARCITPRNRIAKAIVRF